MRPNTSPETRLSSEAEQGDTVNSSSIDNFRDALENVLKHAGLPGIRVHDLRHTLAANFMMSGGNILSLQKILGHSTMQMTMRSAHLAPEFLHKEMEKHYLGHTREEKISPLESASQVQNGSDNFGKIDSKSEKFGHKMGAVSINENNPQKEKSSNPLISLVPGEGIEPSRSQAPGDFKSPTSSIPSPGHYENLNKLRVVRSPSGSQVAEILTQPQEHSKLQSRTGSSL